MTDPGDLSHSDRQRLFEIADDLIERQAANYAELTFQTAWNLEGAVNNGGFATYFSGFAGGNAREAPSALRAIGAVAMADIVERALNILPDIDWPNTEMREQIITNLPAESLLALEKLEDEFMAYPDGDTEKFHWAFICANPKSFQRPN
jgi:hypothetical protein